MVPPLNIQSLVPLGVFNSNFWPFGAISTSSFVVVDTEKGRCEVSGDVQIVGTNLVGVEVRRIRTDLADLMNWSWTTFIQEV